MTPFVVFLTALSFALIDLLTSKHYIVDAVSRQYDFWINRKFHCSNADSLQQPEKTHLFLLLLLHI